MYSMRSMCCSGVDDLFGGDGMWVGGGGLHPSWMDKVYLLQRSTLATALVCNSLWLAFSGDALTMNIYKLLLLCRYGMKC